MKLNKSAQNRYSVPVVREMQVLMQQLAQSIFSTINYDAITQGLSAQQNNQEFSKSFGRDAFGNVLVNKLQQVDVKGSEFITDPSKTKMEEKMPSNLKNLFGILDTINRIGSSSSEFKTDGIWGPRTNNGLLNIIALTNVILDLGRELGLDSKSFNYEKLNELKSFVPQKDTDISFEEKSNRAAKILPFLKGINALFTDFRQQIMQNPYYKQYIERDAKFFSFGPQKKAPTANEKAVLDDIIKNKQNTQYLTNKPYAVFTVKMQNPYTPDYASTYQITAADLVDKNAFEQWVKINLQDIPKEHINEYIPKLLQRVKQSIQNNLGTVQKAGQ